VTVDGQQLLASTSQKRKAQIRDPQTGKQRAVLQGQRAWLCGAGAVCAVTVSGRQLLATGGRDHMVRIWDPRTGEHRAALAGHEAVVNGVCAVTVDGRQLLASASGDRTVRIWDPATGVPLVTIPVHYTAWAVGQVADVLAIGLEVGIVAVRLNIGS
jgi:WD40 repeat protein